MGVGTEEGYSKRTASGLLVSDGALGLVGGTPLVKLSKIAPQCELFAKVEFWNATGSIKDRPALRMVLAAEATGKLKPGATLVEATSGNTGISLAMIAAVRGYRCMLVMPEDMSLERRYLLKAYGAEIVLTPAQEGMVGAVQRAVALERETPGAFMPRQFDNAENPESHARTTAEEILEQCDGRLDAFVAGVGTGGTVTGVGRVLKERLGRSVKVIAVEPQNSAVLSGGQAGLHGIQGLGAGFVPEILDRSVIDEVIPVSDIAADRMMRRLSSEQGLLVGPSSGANVHAALQVGGTSGSRIVTILCDSGERYLF